MDKKHMHRKLLTLFLLVALLPIGNLTAKAQDITEAAPEPQDGAVVCPPGVYTSAPDDCLPLGPSEYLTQNAAQGIPYPILPLPAYSPDTSLNDLPYQYFKVSDAGASLYPSLDAAVANQASKILFKSNDLYVSYQGSAVKDGNESYYQLLSNYWIPAEGGRLGKFDPPFQGLLFSSQPRNSFGWVLGTVKSYTSPGLNAKETGNTWYRFNVVSIYDTQKADGLTWYLVAPNEWLNAVNVRRVDPHTDAPKGVTGNRWIEVNLAEQTVSVYDKNRLIFATMASTGVDHFWTRPGLFQIQKKLDATTMSNSVQDDFYYLEDVPWTMYFDEGRALHGAYWHNKFGYRFSHGCVNLSPGDAHWLYNWASVGEFVYVYDPSGQTPTDPALFGTGAP
jgi:L,D-transpeptidase catalytic domain